MKPSTFLLAAIRNHLAVTQDDLDAYTQWVDIHNEEANPATNAELPQRSPYLCYAITRYQYSLLTTTRHKNRCPRTAALYEQKIEKIVEEVRTAIKDCLCFNSFQYTIFDSYLRAIEGSDYVSNLAPAQLAKCRYDWALTIVATLRQEGR